MAADAKEYDAPEKAYAEFKHVLATGAKIQRCLMSEKYRIVLSELEVKKEGLA